MPREVFRVDAVFFPASVVVAAPTAVPEAVFDADADAEDTPTVVVG